MEILVCVVSADGGAFIEGAVAPGEHIKNTIVLGVARCDAGWRHIRRLGKMEDLVGNLKSPVVAFSKVVGHELLEGCRWKHDCNGRGVEL